MPIKYWKNSHLPFSKTNAYEQVDTTLIKMKANISKVRNTSVFTHVPIKEIFRKEESLIRTVVPLC